MVTTRSADRRKDDLVLRSRSIAQDSPIPTPTRSSKRVKALNAENDGQPQTPNVHALNNDVEDQSASAPGQTSISTRTIFATPMPESINRDVFQTPATSLRTNTANVVNFENLPNPASAESINEYHTAEEGESDGGPEELSAKPSSKRRTPRSSRGQRKEKALSTVIEVSDTANDPVMEVSSIDIGDRDDEHISMPSAEPVEEYYDQAHSTADQEMDIDEPKGVLDLFRPATAESQVSRNVQTYQQENNIDDRENVRVGLKQRIPKSSLPRQRGTSFEEYRQRKLSRHRKQGTWRSKRSFFVTAS